MMQWREHLGVELAKAEKVAVLGAGSVLCGDDAAGMLVAAALKEKGRGLSQLLAVEGSTAPENFTGVIRDFAPDLLVLVDAAHISGELGDIAVIKKEELSTTGFSTHMLPFGVLFSYLETAIGCKIIVIGIKPDNMEFDTEPCSAICASANELADFIINNI